jgi:hypothetical protein
LYSTPSWASQHIASSINLWFHLYFILTYFYPKVFLLLLFDISWIRHVKMLRPFRGALFKFISKLVCSSNILITWHLSYVNHCIGVTLWISTVGHSAGIGLVYATSFDLRLWFGLGWLLLLLLLLLIFCIESSKVKELSQVTGKSSILYKFVLN